MKTKTISQTLALLFFVLTASAQQGINYKAIINDANGDVLINTAVTIQFTILENGNTSVYQESHATTTDANGIIIVNIGEGSVVSGVFNDIDWGANPHLLKTEINTGSGLTDMGTTEFKTVPYALHAKTAEDAATKAYVDQLAIRIEHLENLINELLPDIDNDGYTANEGDCNDNDASIYPGAQEICDDGIDQNCNGADMPCMGCPPGQEIYNDDCIFCLPGTYKATTGFSSCVPCQDGTYSATNGANTCYQCAPGFTSNLTHTGCVECPAGTYSTGGTPCMVCPEGTYSLPGSSSCIPLPSEDADGDGFTENDGDCNDTDNSIYPGATEICDDGIDQDCDGEDLVCLETGFLIISEYVEGTSSNKAIELFNVSTETINLINYSLKIGFNGGSWESYEIQFPDFNLQSGATYVIVNASADDVLTSFGDFLTGTLSFNGNDAVGLFYGNELIDVIGEYLIDPGGGWDVDGIPSATANHTLRRELTVTMGNIEWSTNETDSEWIVYEVDTYDNLGTR